MSIKFIIHCIAALGLALIIGRWHQQERIKNRFAGKPWYVDYLNLPSLIIYLLFIALMLLRLYVIRTGGISFR